MTSLPMEENQWLLAQDYKHRVSQLGHLGQDEHEGPKAADLVTLDEAKGKFELELMNVLAGSDSSPWYTH